jgi:hypothetical protein
MNTSFLVQYLVIGVLVAISALVMFRKLAPQLSSRWLAAASIALSRPHHAAWLRAFGRRLQPKQATGNCSDGCSTCGSCGPKPPAAATRSNDVIPLEFRPRHR